MEYFSEGCWDLLNHALEKGEEMGNKAMMVRRTITPNYKDQVVEQQMVAIRRTRMA